LFEEIKTNGMAVCGADDSLKALKARQVDVLVLAQDFAAEAGWYCASCFSVGTCVGKTDCCPECGSVEVEKIDIKEEIVKTAERYECRIETVKHSEILMELGGVGCLLRFLTPEQYQKGYFDSSARSLVLGTA
jgi:peptide subunit release factor 1 (eRF1)